MLLIIFISCRRRELATGDDSTHTVAALLLGSDMRLLLKCLMEIFTTGSIFVVLAIISIRYRNIVLWEHGDKSDGTKSPISPNLSGRQN